MSGNVQGAALLLFAFFISGRVEAVKRVGGRRQTCTSVLKWPSKAIALLSAPLCFLWVPVEEWRGLQGRRKASFRNAFHLHFYNKTSKFWLIIRALLSTKSRMIKAHISNDCEPEVKSFSLTDGGIVYPAKVYTFSSNKKRASRHSVFILKPCVCRQGLQDEGEKMQPHFQLCV